MINSTAIRFPFMINCPRTMHVLHLRTLTPSRSASPLHVNRLADSHLNRGSRCGVAAKGWSARVEVDKAALVDDFEHGHSTAINKTIDPRAISARTQRRRSLFASLMSPNSLARQP
jgi:hypothetical protein